MIEWKSIIFVFPILFLIYCLAYFLTRNKTNHPLLKRAQGYPIIGNLFDFMPQNFLATARNYPLQYGSIVEYYLFNLRGLFVTDLEMAREISMKRPKKFTRTRNLVYSATVLNMNKALFNTYGTEWYHIRKATAPSFSQMNVVNKISKIAEEMFLWMKRLEDLSEQGTKEVDMKPQSFSLTIRVITIVAFGLETSNPLCAYFFSDQFLQDMDALFTFSLESVLFFWPRMFWKYSAKYMYEIKGREANERFSNACCEIVQSKKQFLSGSSTATSGLSRPTSMIDSMINKELQGSESALTDDEIIQNVKVVYLAGSDTTAVTISWVSYFFATHPHYLLRAREEAGKVLFASAGSQQDCIARMTQTSINELQFCFACVKEALRLVSPASTSGNQVYGGEPVTLSNGITMGKDDVAWVNLDGIHYNASIFDHPMEYQPDRWLTSDKDKLSAMEANYMPFGYGPRICPGMTLAYYEAVLAIAFLAYHYDLQLNCPPTEVVRIRSFTASPNKVPAILKKVNRITQQ